MENTKTESIASTNLEFPSEDIGSTIEDTSSTTITVLRPKEQPLEHKRENARLIIAGSILALLVMIIAVIPISLIWISPSNDSARVDIFMKWFQTVFNPVLTLLGTIVGFYFGAQTVSSNKL